jgi:hypothetical protein
MTDTTSPDETVFGPVPAAEPRRGLILSVYRNAELGDCTNGGITATANAVTVTGIRRGSRTRKPAAVEPLPRSMRVFTPSERAPEVTLVIRDNGSGGTWLSLEPAGADESRWWMAGGNYAGSSDSRWSELCGAGAGGGHPVSVHDRSETWQQYEQLST